MPLAKRSKRNPILWPNRENAWEAEAAFNGSAVHDHSHVDLFYRAESAPQKLGDIELRLSTVGHAISSDGVRFSKREQIITPQYDWERFGCEDPRATKFGDKYYIFYTALSTYPFGPDGIKIGLAEGKDLKNLKKHPVTTFNAKAMALFPKHVKGKMAAILTANTDKPPAKIGLAIFDHEEEIWSPAYWDDWYASLESHTIPLQRDENDHIEVGAPPIWTEKGWLVIYSYIRNYFHGQKIFGVEAALLDLDDPRKILSRTDLPFLTPEEEYELYGRVPNIVFPSGAYVKKDVLYVYYGATDTTCCLATLSLTKLLEEMASTTVKLKRFEGNPILVPDRNHAWEAKCVFNPAAFFADGKIHILYRSLSDDDTSYIGYAWSTDGKHIDGRLPDPIYTPSEKFELKTRPGVGSGCEDPRVTLIDDTLYMCYTAYDGVNPPRIALTSIALADFLKQDWKWAKPVLISPPGIDDKDAAIFPKKIKGKYVILHRIGLSMWIDFVDDLKQFQGERWVEGCVLMKPRPTMWDSRKIGIGSPPIETPDGWLLLYHGISKREDGHYHVRAALLDLKDPTKVLARTKYPIFEPETPYELNGLVPRVVFPCGAILKKTTLYVYYGGADKVVGVATIKIAQLLDQLKAERTNTRSSKAGKKLCRTS